MKTFLKVTAIIIGFLIIAIIAIPLIFKDDLVKIAKKETNKALNAKVDFGDFSLSLIRSFPDFHLAMENVSISGVDEFEGIDLAKVKEVDLVVDLMSVINGDNIIVKSIILDEPAIYAQVLSDGKVNWDIAKVDTTQTQTVSDTAGSFQMQLDNIEVIEGIVIYDDASLPLFMLLDGVNLQLQGNLNEQITSITTNGSIDKLDLEFDGIKYIHEAVVNLQADMDADMENMKFTFNENELVINQLPLAFDGWLAMPEEEMDMDLTFAAKDTDFKTILSLVPAEFTKDLEGVETSGDVSLSGFAKGIFLDSIYPAFGLDMKVSDAMFNYPDLPSSVQDIQMIANIQSPGGVLDNMEINVSNFHMVMADNPFDLTLFMTQPMSDPYMKATAKGTIMLSNLKDVVPMEEGDRIEGTFVADMNVDGRMSTLENEQYEQFKASGTLQAHDFHYSSDSLDYPVDISRADLSFNNQYADLSNLDMKVGNSDIKATGRLENFIPYAMTDNGVLKGNVNMTSNLLDANELMGIDPNAVEETPTPEDDTPMEVVLVPKNVEMKLSANIQKLLYDNLEINEVVGNVDLRDEKISIANSSLKMLGGAMALKGFYETTDSLKPTFDFGIDIDKFNITETANKFVSIEKIAPIIQKAVGEYSTKFNINGAFDGNMNPIYSSLFGEGNLLTDNVEIKDFKALEKIGNALNSQTLQNPVLKDLKMSLKVADGKLWVEPFTNVYEDIKMTVAGSNSFDQTLDYVLSFQVPREKLGSSANNAVDNLFSQASAKGIDLNLAETINVDARITGPFTDPAVKIDLKQAVSNITDDLKNQAKQAVDQKKEELRNQAREEIEKQKAEAEDKLRQEIEKQRKEAEDKAKKEMEKELEDKGRDKLKDLFGK